jgi:hypothetical protein
MGRRARRGANTVEAVIVLAVLSLVAAAVYQLC